MSYFKRVGLGVVPVLAMGLPLHAVAQSSVTLYGIVDTGFEFVNHLPGTAGSGNVVRMVAGSRSGSRWGLQGTEDLGAGNSVFFRIENGFDSTNGALGQSTTGLGNNATTLRREFGRSAYVGLKHDTQQISFGRQQNLLYDYAGYYDPMLVALRYSVYSFDPVLSGRPDDAIKYRGGFGPITIDALYSTRYDTGYGLEVAGAPLTGREFSVALNYAQGPFGAGVVYDQMNGNTVASNTANQKRVEVGASYERDKAKMYIGYRFLRSGAGFLPTYAVAAVAGQSATFANLYWAGVRYQFTTPLSATAAAYYQNYRDVGDEAMFELVGNYAFSKRTDVYALAAVTMNSRRTNLGVDGIGTAEMGARQTGIVIGLRHRF